MTGRLPAASKAVVIGAGPAGLGTAAMLGKAGIEAQVLDAAPRVASSWHARYDGFRLNTSSWFSYLPGQRFPRGPDQWPSREAVVGYYERYAARNALQLTLDTEVERVERGDQGWLVATSRGTIGARYVVVATGNYRSPVLPPWPGSEGFSGELVHASDYRNAAPYRGQDVLVVGTGNSAVDIAVGLADDGAARTRVSMRTPPHIVRRRIGPIPVDAFGVLMRHVPPRIVDRLGRRLRRLTFGDLAPYGLPEPPEGVYTHVINTGRIPTVAGPFVNAVKAGRIDVVAAVQRFDGSYVVLADGSRIAPDVVVAATGYRRDLEPLVGHLGVLTSEGRPEALGPDTVPGAPRLHFIGFTEPFSGPLREIRLLSKRTARSIAAADAGEPPFAPPHARPATPAASAAR